VFYLGIVEEVSAALHRWPYWWQPLSSSWLLVLHFLSRRVRATDFPSLPGFSTGDGWFPAVFRTAAFLAGSPVRQGTDACCGLRIHAEKLAASHYDVLPANWGLYYMAASGRSVGRTAAAFLLGPVQTFSALRNRCAPCMNSADAPELVPEDADWP
jgi:hypothetical protein